jgi:hypothetical protein
LRVVFCSDKEKNKGNRPKEKKKEKENCLLVCLLEWMMVIKGERKGRVGRGIQEILIANTRR